jgi:flagellar motor switch protein FliG
MPDIIKEKLSGSERAAILLMSLGEQSASEVLKHMEPREVQKVGMTMSTISNVTKEDVKSILSEFTQTVDNQASFSIGSKEYIRNVLVKAVGEDKAGGLVDRIMQGGDTKGLEKLKWMEPKAVAESIRLEHPQIIAIMLSYLDAEVSAEVLGYLPTSIRADVVMRIAALDGIPPAALMELNDVMEKQYSGKSNMKASGVGGIKAAANILNYLESSVESKLMEEIKTADENMCNQIEENMFVFDDLVDLDDRDMQSLLREVPSDKLLIALKGASEKFKEKVFKNMSSRAAEMMKDDMDAKGPVKLSDVESAQKEILAAARKLADGGNINLGGKGSETYV